MDVIPLRKFVPSSNSNDRRQKEVGASRNRQRALVEASDEEEAAPATLTPRSTQGKGKLRLASQPAPISDDSDFDKDEEQEEGRKSGKSGRQSKKLDPKSRNDSSSLKRKGTRNNGLASNRNSSSPMDELEVAEDDSQTFAGFKMRIAAQEQVRIVNEREHTRSGTVKRSQKKMKADLKKQTVIEIDEDDDDSDVDRTKIISSTSVLSQSIQVSRRTRLAQPGFALGESLPYNLMKKYQADDGKDEDEEDAEVSEIVSGIKVDPSDREKKQSSRTSGRAQTPINRHTLLGLLLINDRQRGSSSRKKRSRSGSESDSNSESESDKDADKPFSAPGDATSRPGPLPPDPLKEPGQAEELDDDDLSSEDEGDLLVFDTKIGKLIRPNPPSGQSATTKAPGEEGQSEEEDGYQAPAADEKAPKKSDPGHLKYLADRSKIVVQENAEAERRAKELGMKPSFKCSAEKQRKKPYSLDPHNPRIVVPIAISRFLRRYQRTGIQFFYDRYKGIKVEGIGVVKGGVLGDDMGLGKTIQVLGFLSAIMEKTGTRADLSRRLSRKGRVRDREGPCTPFTFGPTCLITCPKTLVTNWKREIETWTYLSVGTIESKADRDAVITKYKNGFLDVVLIPFDRLVSDLEFLQSVSFSIMIIDEAHNIKNPGATRTLAMKSIKAECRFAMTGTLIQNRFQEMWSVLDFVVPGLVGEHGEWKRIMAKTVDEGMDQKATVEGIAKRKVITDELHKNILPLLFLRRTKAAVALELPKKNDHVVFCPLTQVQELVYKRIEAQPDLQAFLKRNGPCPNHPQRRAKDCCFVPAQAAALETIDKGIVFRYIDVFKKVSSHIGLVYSQPDDNGEQKLLCQRLMDICFPTSREEQIHQIGLMDRDQVEDYIPEDIAVIDEELRPTDMDPYYRNLPSYKASILSEFSGKWVILNALLRSWKEDVHGQHKVLIFSSSVKLLKMLQDFIEREYNCEMLHGGVKDEDRMAAVDRFQRPDSNVFVFLISTLAGGVGLNLTAANKVIIFDPNWNPAHDLQAMDRAFRMGQKRDVDVYRLISLGTIEENIYERQMRKSAAMRIIYEDAVDSRVFEGHEGKGVTGDLWGVNNLFRYSPEGTSLQRAARLEFEEEQLANNLKGIIDSKGIRTFKIETSYEEGDEQLLQGTERGTEISSVSEDATLLEAIGEFFPGLRRERVAKAPTQPSAVEQFIVEQAVEDYHNNPSARNRPANEYYRDANVTKNIKGKRTSFKRKSDDMGGGEMERKAPRLTVTKSERVAGLVSDDDD